MPTIVAQNDAIIRIAQVILDPDTDPERVEAIRDYFSIDLADMDGWLSDVRAAIPGAYPSSVTMVDDQDTFRAALPDAEAVIVESLTIGADELDAAPKLKIVQKFGTDTRNIDLDACAARGVEVCTLRRRVNVAVAEHAFAMMLALAKKIVPTHGLLDTESLEAAGYEPRMFDRRHIGGANWARVPGLVSLQGLTLGALGMGEIGREVASRARAFEMDVLYHQRNRLPDAIEQELGGATYCSFNDLIAQSDVISIHLPLNNATEGMIDGAAIAAMKPGAMLINISRATIIDREALLEGLSSGALGGAGLDVHYKEPADPGDPLLAFDNVVLTPHTAVATRLNGARDMQELAANLHNALAG